MLFIFTGNYSREKHTLAISISYIVALIFLVLHLIAPVVLPYYPNIMKAMADGPVGILRVEEANDVQINQWALHIGAIPSLVSTSKDSLITNYSDSVITVEKYSLKNGLVIPLFVLMALLGDGRDNGREQVHLSNSSSSSVNVINWILRDRADHEFTLNATIPANDELTITIPAGELPLTNSGDNVFLFDPNMQLIQQVSYTKSQAKSGVPIEF